MIKRIGLLLISMALLAACGGDDDKEPKAASPQDEIVVSEAWVRALPEGMSGDGVTGAFMVIENQGEQDQRLIRVEVGADTAEVVEIHETTIGANDVMQMRPVDGVAIPAGETVELKPGSYHLMLGVQQALSPGDTLTLTLHFERDQVVTVQADVRAMEMQ